jgi:hypothetical protein
MGSIWDFSYEYVELEFLSILSQGSGTKDYTGLIDPPPPQKKGRFYEMGRPHCALAD